MAKDSKVKGVNADKRAKVILVITIAVLAIFAIGYFVYISGLLPKTMVGMKVVQVAEDGSQTTLENISVLETSFHYYQVVNTYAQQGYLNGIQDVDAVADEATGRTYRQMLLNLAADEVVNIVAVNREAAANGFTQYSAADRVAELALEQMEMTSTMYGYNSVDQYLTAMYGAGMTSRAYRSFYARQILTNEYEQYMRQFLFTVSEAELQAEFENNPTSYQRADFNIYYFAYEMDEDGIYDTSSVTSKVNKVMRSTDSDSFRDNVVEALGEEDAILAGFVDDANPTLCKKYTSANTTMMVEGLTDIVFGEDATIGTCQKIEVDTGVYIVLVNDVYIDETPVVSYRSLTIYNNDYDATNAPEVTAAQMAALTAEAQGYVAGITTSLDFMVAVKQHSDIQSEIVYGGFNDGVIESEQYQPYYDMVGTDAADLNTVPRANLGHWLFDENRNFGDTYVFEDPNHQYVTIYFFENSVPNWVYTAQNQLITSRVNGWAQTVVPANVTYTIAYDLIKNLTTPL